MELFATTAPKGSNETVRVATASWGKVAQVLVHQWGCRDGIAAELWLQTGDLIPCPPATRRPHRTTRPRRRLGLRPSWSTTPSTACRSSASPNGVPLPTTDRDAILHRAQFGRVLTTSARALRSNSMDGKPVGDIRVLN